MAEEGIAILAYSFMPDHVHLLLQGMSEQANLRRAIARWKQAVGYWHSRQKRGRLWMAGYHDHVLRGSESVMDLVLYVMANPVKAGLSLELGEHPFTGSDVYGLEELREVFEQA